MGCTGSRSKSAATNNKNRSGQKKKGEEAQNTGVAAFKPNADLQAAYKAYIEGVRRQMYAEGINNDADVESNHEVSRLDKDNNAKQSGKGRRGSKKDNEIVGSSEMQTAGRALVFQCRPLTFRQPIASGRHGDVLLACMVLFPVDLAAADVAAQMRAVGPAVSDYTKKNDTENIIANNKATSNGNSGGCDTDGPSSPVTGNPSTTKKAAKANKKGKKSKKGGTNETKNNSSNNNNTNNVGIPQKIIKDDAVAISVRDVHLSVPAPSSSPPERRFLIAMKEFVVDDPRMPRSRINTIVKEIHKWTRLSAYCDRIVRCIQTESVYRRNAKAKSIKGPGDDDANNDEDDSTYFSVVEPNATYQYHQTRRAGGSSDDFRPGHQKGAQLCNIRVYMELAKYGTLRRFLEHEMPSRYKEDHLHELTARVLMREVLLALMCIHEGGEIQYDICAERIHLHASLPHIYHSYFPAYISDLPVTKLEAVPPSRFPDVLALMNPGKQQADQAGSRSQANMRPVSMQNSPFPEAAPTLEAMYQDLYNFSRTAFRSGQDNEASAEYVCNQPVRSQSDYIHSLPQASTSGITLSAELNSNHDPFGANAAVRRYPSESNNNRTVRSNTSDDVEQPYEVIQAHLAAHGYEDVMEIPLPSPHDGHRGYLEATTIAKNTHEKELAAKGQGVQVVPLKGTPPSVGGIAIVQPLRFESRADAVGNDGESGSPAACGDEGKDGGDNGMASVPPPPQLLIPGTDMSGFVPIVNGTSSGSPTNTNTMSSLVLSSNSQDLNIKSDDNTQSPHRRKPSGLLRRPKPPALKLMHTAAVRRCFANVSGGIDEERVPAHAFVSVAHAAPEVLRENDFSIASDVYCFAMTFLELVCAGGEIMQQCLPAAAPPRTPAERAAYNRQYAANLSKWYGETGPNCEEVYDAAQADAGGSTSPKEPALDPVRPHIPAHLSEECKHMLRWCLQECPHKRPNVAQLLASKYFMRGDWVSDSPKRASGSAEGNNAKGPEDPWTDVHYEEAAVASGLPHVPAAMLTPAPRRN